MKKVLLISGSPRKGNTEFILQKIHSDIKNCKKQLLLLRKLDINYCTGCLKCDKTNQCITKDDMSKIKPIIEQSDLIIIGTPNYFDNVSGLLKNFIDRTNPYYNTNILKNKKIIFIVIGGGSIKNSRRVVSNALKYFSDGHNMKIINSYIFKALKPNEIKNDLKYQSKIKKIANEINTMI